VAETSNHRAIKQKTLETGFFNFIELIALCQLC